MATGIGTLDKRPVEEVAVRGVQPAILPDPANAGTINAKSTAYCELTSGEDGWGTAGTRTLADPTFKGQILDLVFVTDGNADITITASSPINQAGNTSAVTADVGDHLRLMGHSNPTDGLEWRVIANDGWTLS